MLTRALEEAVDPLGSFLEAVHHGMVTAIEGRFRV